jgi:exopolysaccharide biosynthesis protein
MRRNGFAHVLVLVVLAAIIVIGVTIFKNKLVSINSPEVSPVADVTKSPSPIPTPTPTPTTSPTPMTTLKPTPTSRPTYKPVSGPPGSGLSTITVATDKGNFTATVLSLDMRNAKVITDTANDGDCGNGCAVSNLQAFVSKNAGFAGVNGTYFCPITYPECSTKTNSFDFPVYNTRLGHWINGGNLFWDSRAMVYFDGSGGHYVQDAKSFSGSLSAGIVNYPGLVNDGNIQIDDNQSGLSDKQKAKGTKVGMGIRENTIMVVVAMNVNMQEFAYVFKSLGATGALNLDTGGSIALYNDGRYVYGPGRDIPNAVIFASK